MEDKCIPLGNLKPNNENWFVKALVVEKTPIRFGRWGRQQKIVFMDKESRTMQGIIYDSDVDQLDKLLELYKTYYIGNAKVKEIMGTTPLLAASKHQMILSRSTYIKLVSQHYQLPTDNIYQLTPFSYFPQAADITNKQIS